MRPKTRAQRHLLCHVRPYWHVPAGHLGFELLFVVRGLATVVAAYDINGAGTRLVTDLRNAMVAKFLTAPIA